MNRLHITCFCLAAFTVPALALAQQNPRPDPADPRSRVPPAIYVSPLKQYQPLGEAQFTPWKATNDTVEKVGGWKVYAKEAHETGPAAGKSAAPVKQAAPPTTQPAHGDHSSHGMK